MDGNSFAHSVMLSRLTGPFIFIEFSYDGLTEIGLLLSTLALLRGTSKVIVQTLTQHPHGRPAIEHCSRSSSFDGLDCGSENGVN